MIIASRGDYVLRVIYLILFYFIILYWGEGGFLPNLQGQ